MSKVKVQIEADEESWDMEPDLTEEEPVRAGSLNPQGEKLKEAAMPPAGPRRIPSKVHGSPKGKNRKPATQGISRKEERRGPVNRAAKGFLKWTIRAFICILIVFFLFAPGFPFHEIREATGLNKLKDLMRPYREFPEWANVSMEVVYDLTISNGAANKVLIQVAPPFDIPAELKRASSSDFIIQDVVDIELTPDPTIPLMDWDDQANRMTGWELTGVRGLRQMTVRFDLTVHTYEWDLEEEESGTVDDIPENYSIFLDDEWEVKNGTDPRDDNHDGLPDYYRYHPSDPTISRIARSITHGETTVLGMVKEIYDWIKDHFNYTTKEQRIRDEREYGSYPKWPLGCLDDWYGDCDDQSLLMASLCRAIGIPAWLEIGYLYDPLEGNWGGHGWFNVYIPLKRGGHIIAPIDPVNSEFLFRDPYRITDWIDTGGTVADSDGKIIFNLDYYYDFFHIDSSTGVKHEITVTHNNIKFEPHGKIKRFVNERIDPGNLPGSQTQFSTPAPSPVLLAPLTSLLAIPALRAYLSRRRDGR